MAVIGRVILDQEGYAQKVKEVDDGERNAYKCEWLERRAEGAPCVDFVRSIFLDKAGSGVTRKYSMVAEVWMEALSVSSPMQRARNSLGSFNRSSDKVPHPFLSIAETSTAT